MDPPSRTKTLRLTLLWRCSKLVDAVLSLVCPGSSGRARVCGCDLCRGTADGSVAHGGGGTMGGSGGGRQVRGGSQRVRRCGARQVRGPCVASPRSVHGLQREQRCDRRASQGSLRGRGRDRAGPDQTPLAVLRQHGEACCPRVTEALRPTLCVASGL